MVSMITNTHMTQGQLRLLTNLAQSVGALIELLVKVVHVIGAMYMNTLFLKHSDSKVKASEQTKV